MLSQNDFHSLFWRCPGPSMKSPGSSAGCNLRIIARSRLLPTSWLVVPGDLIWADTAAVAGAMFDKRREDRSRILHQLETRIPRKVEVMKKLMWSRCWVVCLLLCSWPDRCAGPDNYVHPREHPAVGPDNFRGFGYAWHGGRDVAPITIAAPRRPPTALFRTPGHNTISIGMRPMSP